MGVGVGAGVGVSVGACARAFVRVHTALHAGAGLFGAKLFGVPPHRMGILSNRKLLYCSDKRRRLGRQKII